MKLKVSLLLLLVALLGSYFVPRTLSKNYLALGSGPDEVSHIDYTFFLHQDEGEVNVTKGYTHFDVAPLGQGHQPPFSYWLGAKFLDIFGSGKETRFVDYESGMLYTSDFYAPQCMFSQKPNFNSEVKEDILFLRNLNTLYFSLSVLLVYLTCFYLFPGNPLIAASASLFYASIPTAIWRSTFVTNDNLISFLGVAIFSITALSFSREKKPSYLVLAGLTVLCALAFLTKYNGAIFVVGPAALVLFGGGSLFDKFKAGLFSSLIFLAFVVPDLLENLRVDGDILSYAVITRVAVGLHQPGSLLDVLSNTSLYHSILKRFWLCFHFLIGFDPEFPFWPFKLWWAILGLSLLGWFAFAVRGAKRALLPCSVSVVQLAAGFCALMALFMVNFFLTFPLPEGRYAHPILLPVIILILTGLSQLVPQKFRDWFLVLITAGVFVVMNTLSFTYLKGRHQQCVEDPKHYVESGVDYFTVDMDADGKEELVLLHRMRNRFFIYREEGDKLSPVPEWTRMWVSLNAQVMSENVLGADDEEILLWRPGISLFQILDRKQFLKHDESLSPYPEVAIKPKDIYLDQDYRSKGFVKDLNADGKAEVILFLDGVWTVWKDFKKRFEFKGFKTEQPFLVQLGTESFFGGIEKEELRLTSTSGNYLSFYIGKRHIKAIDVDSDGRDELVSWLDGESCLRVDFLDIKGVGSEKRCFTDVVFDEHSKIIFLNGKAVHLSHINAEGIVVKAPGEQYRFKL